MTNWPYQININVFAKGVNNSGHATSTGAWLFTEYYVFVCVCVEVLRPSEQLNSCRAGQLPINTVPGQA